MPGPDTALAGSLGYQADPTDATTGLVDMGARHYLPSLGRFLTKDPVAGALEAPITLNPYIYGADDPVTLIDPDGRKVACPTNNQSCDAEGNEASSHYRHARSAPLDLGVASWSSVIAYDNFSVRVLSLSKVEEELRARLQGLGWQEAETILGSLDLLYAAGRATLATSGGAEAVRSPAALERLVASAFKLSTSDHARRLGFVFSGLAGAAVYKAARDAGVRPGEAGWRAAGGIFGGGAGVWVAKKVLCGATFWRCLAVTIASGGVGSDVGSAIGAPIGRVLDPLFNPTLERPASHRQLHRRPWLLLLREQPDLLPRRGKLL